MSWDIKADNRGVEATLHADENTSVEVKGFTEGTGHPPFVLLTVAEGKYPNRSSVELYLSPEQAGAMMRDLETAILTALEVEDIPE